MVKFTRLLAIVAATLLAVSAQAKDPAAYKIGDVADTDLSTPVALDVIDPQATATLKSSEALKTPAIFESYPAATNEVVRQFSSVFAATRSDFIASLLDAFHQAPLTNSVIASPDFNYFVTAFDTKYKNFPISTSLAAIWAQGGSGALQENALLALLMQTMAQPIRPDAQLTFVLGDTVQLVPVNDPDQRPSLENASHGQIITSTSIITLSQARAELRSQFSQENQLFARALAEMLVPDCAPDKNLTQAARDQAVNGLVVDNHFDAGQIIIRRGETIDSRTKAALDELNEKLMPGVLTRQIAAEQAQELREEQQAQQEKEQAELALQQQQEAQQERDLAQTDAQRERAQASAMQQQAMLAQSQERASHARNIWLATACVVISVIALVVLWLSYRQRRTTVGPITVPATLSRAEQKSPVVSSEFAPHLARAVKEALVQELAAQRREMLSVQQTATTEISELVRRLDQLQIPLQERLRTYEMQIQQLEKDLAVRTEENRELLKMKIEMMRRQLEAERKRVDFN